MIKAKDEKPKGGGGRGARPKAAVEKARPATPVTEQAEAEAAVEGGETTSMLVTGVPRVWLPRLEAARAAGGYRSRNALVLALIEKGLK